MKICLLPENLGEEPTNCFFEFQKKSAVEKGLAGKYLQMKMPSCPK
jgi:hypothetical protein